GAIAYKIGGKLISNADEAYKLVAQRLNLPTVSSAGLASKGVSVLGHHPEYIDLANEINARRFNIPTEVWKEMSDPERWVANQKFLDRMIARGDKIQLATPIEKVKPGTYYEKELNYLFSKGYKIEGTYL